MILVFLGIFAFGIGLGLTIVHLLQTGAHDFAEQVSLEVLTLKSLHEKRSEDS